MFRVVADRPVWPRKPRKCPGAGGSAAGGGAGGHNLHQPRHHLEALQSLEARGRPQLHQPRLRSGRINPRPLMTYRNNSFNEFFNYSVSKKTLLSEMQLFGAYTASL